MSEQNKARGKSRRRSKGLGTIQKRGRRFLLQVRIEDRARCVTLRNPDGTPCSDRRQAETAANLMQAALALDSREQLAAFTAEARKLKAAVQPLRLIDLWDTYLKTQTRPDSGPVTLKGYHGVVRLFCAWAKKRGLANVADVTPEEAGLFLNDAADDVSPRRFNAIVQALRLVFEHVGKRIGCEGNPFAEIRRKKLETISRQAFTAEQVQAIFASFDRGFFYETEVEGLGPGRERERKAVQLEWKPMFADELRVMLYLCCYTGCRGQDAALMSWRAVNFGNNAISYVPRKTARTSRKAVTLPLHTDLKDALRGALEWRQPTSNGDDYILPNIAERFTRNPRGVQADVQRAINLATGLHTTIAVKTSGKRKLASSIYSLHSFRHTFVSFCSNAGVPLSLVAEVVGHSSPAMTQHYSHVSLEAQNRAISSLPSANPENEPVDEKSTLRKQLSFLLENADVKQLKAAIRALKP